MVRNYAIDNVKFLTIVAVVFGHLIEPNIGTQDVTRTVYFFVYSFHMPLFVMLSGMYAKNTMNGSDARKLLASIAIPFVVFTLLYEGSELAAKGTLSSYSSNLRPYWILWFLVSLFAWRILLPVVSKLRYPLLTSVVIAVAAGFFDQIDYFLGIARTLYFFPFFLIGYRLGSEVFNAEWVEKTPRYCYVAILFTGLLACWFLKDQPRGWLYGSVSYLQLNAGAVEGAITRLAMYAVSTVMAISVLLLCPRKELWITRRGENTLYTYLWHGFVIKLLLLASVFSYLEDINQLILIVGTMAASLVVAIVLSTGLVAKLTGRLFFRPLEKIILKPNH